MAWTIESTIMAIIIGTLFITLLAPAFFATYPAGMANSLNITASNGTSSLQGLVYGQTYNISQCGSATTCQNKTGGLNTAPTGIFEGFAFYLQGFGSLMQSLLNAPMIMATLLQQLVAYGGYPISDGITVALQQFIAFIITIVGISALMKYPMRNG